MEVAAEEKLRLAPSARRKIAQGRLRILPLPEIQEKLESGLYQSHVFPRGFILTQITNYDRERVLDVVLLVGDGFSEWKREAVERLAEFARREGCVAIEALSRRGLALELKDTGFRTKQVLLRREVR